MQKNNIRMVVQGYDETAADFAERLQMICEELSVEFKDTIKTIPDVIPTSAHDGRQTATIQFLTIVKNELKSKDCVIINNNRQMLT